MTRMLNFWFCWDNITKTHSAQMTTLQQNWVLTQFARTQTFLCIFTLCKIRLFTHTLREIIADYILSHSENGNKIGGVGLEE